MSKIAFGAIMIAVGVLLNGGIGLLMALNGDYGRALIQVLTAMGLVVGGLLLRRDGRYSEAPAKASSADQS